MTAQELAAEVTTLFSLPDVVVRACAVMDAPGASDQDLIEVIELDANLVATVLRLANSALYGGRGRVDSLSRAIALLGQNTLRDLMLGTAAVQTFRDIPAAFVDMNSFWDNSATSAVLARLIAGRLRIRDRESLFLAGLLLGVGRLVFYVRRPAQYRQVIQQVQLNGISPGDAENLVYGFNHAQLGAALLENWGLPEKLTLPLSHQLTPENAARLQPEAAILHLAGELANHMAPCLKSDYEPDTYQPGSRALYSMQLLALSPAAMKEISLEAQTASLEISEILHPGNIMAYQSGSDASPVWSARSRPLPAQ